MGTTSGPVAITPVQLPEAYEVSQGGVKIATFVDPQHASAYAEFISPAPKPREVFKLGPECRDTEWTRPHPFGTYRWRYDSQNHFWQYLTPGSTIWQNSQYSNPTDVDAIYPYVEVLKKGPRVVEELTEAHRGSEWLRNSGSRYRWNADESTWEYRYEPGFKGYTDADGQWRTFFALPSGGTFTEVLKKESRVVKALDGSCKNATWIRSSTGSIYRYNHSGGYWEFRFTKNDVWMKYAFSDLESPYNPLSSCHYVEVIDGNNA